MRRLKQTFYDKQIPDEIKGISGVIELKGEDLSYDSRKKFLQQQQKEWLEQQIREKRAQAQREKENELIYELQTLEIDKIRGQLESEFYTKKKNIEVKTKSLNLNEAIEKKTKEKMQKCKQIEEERKEVEEILSRGMKRAFVPQTQL